MAGRSDSWLPIYHACMGSPGNAVWTFCNRYIGLSPKNSEHFNCKHNRSIYDISVPVRAYCGSQLCSPKTHSACEERQQIYEELSEIGAEQIELEEEFVRLIYDHIYEGVATLGDLAIITGNCFLLVRGANQRGAQKKILVANCVAGAMGIPAGMRRGYQRLSQIHQNIQRTEALEGRETRLRSRLPKVEGAIPGDEGQTCVQCNLR